MRHSLFQLFGGAARARWIALASGVWGIALAGCGSSGGASSSAAPKPGGKAPPSAPAEIAATNTVAAAAEPRKSVFISTIGEGRDPFFPNSSRRMVKMASSGEGTSAQPRLSVSSYLKLVGIRPGATRPLALINRTTFAPGETAEVTVVTTNAQSHIQVYKVPVHCLEIRPDSVLIRVEGESGTKELHITSRPK